MLLWVFLFFVFPSFILIISATEQMIISKYFWWVRAGMSECTGTEVKNTTKTQDTLSIVCFCTQSSQKLGKLTGENLKSRKLGVKCCELNYCAADDIISYTSTACKACLASRMIFFNQVALNYKENIADKLLLLSL